MYVRRIPRPTPWAIDCRTFRVQNNRRKAYGTWDVAAYSSPVERCPRSSIGIEIGASSRTTSRWRGAIHPVQRPDRAAESRDVEESGTVLPETMIHYQLRSSIECM